LSNRTLSIDDRLYAYILDVAVDERALLRQLREETALLDEGVMQISPEQGQFMSLLVHLTGAEKALEIGTFTGYSAICIARALAEGGHLTCCDNAPQWTAVAEKYWARAGLQERISLETGAAEDTLQALLHDGAEKTFDFVFIDADKQNYIRYYELSLQLLRKGGLMAVDNTLWSGAVADPDNNEPETLAIRRFNEMLRQDTRVTKSLVTIGDGLSLIVKDFD